VLTFTTPPQLPADVLANRDRLPTRLTPVTLTGQYVRLEPLQLERDAEALHTVSNGTPIQLNGRSIDSYDTSLIWHYLFAGPFATLDDLIGYLRPQVEANNGLCMCVFDRASGRQVGVANYMNNAPEHLKVELGSIWYSPIVQRTHANTEATYLMLKHAFELGYRRVEWKCDSLNERSRRAALRMGFQFEGIQDSHMIIKGRNRDTAWFRMLDQDWAEAKMHLEGMLYSS
jgi:RimJ/RimL family protein N-acetyltransferase